MRGPRALIAALLLLAGCGSGERAPAGGIDREAFIATYVELRGAALASPTGTLPEAERERILRERGVTEEELLAFADAHGGDVAYMRELWTEVEARISPPDPDSIG